jgi:hypothetical protein
MNVDNTFLKKQIILQFFIVSNYLLYLINAKTIFIITNCLLILFCLFNVIIDNFNKRIVLTKITILIYIIISIGSPLTEWDARSIWLFHAKRIFFDNDFYSILDNYFELSHNDYPLLAATISASLANLIKGWNEVFPKFANIILMTSPIIFLSYILKNKVKEILFVFVIIFIMEKRIIVGEMDMLLSIYFVINIIGLGYLFFEKKFNQSFLVLYIFFNLIIYSLLKVEALPILLLILIIAIIIKKIRKNKDKKIYLIFLSLLPIVHWKYLVYKNNIESFLTNYSNLEYFLKNIFKFDLHFKIMELLFYSKNAIVSLLFLSYFFIKNTELDARKISINFNREFIKKNYTTILLLCFCLVYFFIVYLMILSSYFAYGLIVEIGRFRYNLPISFGVCYAVIHSNFFVKKIKN